MIDHQKPKESLESSLGQWVIVSFRYKSSVFLKTYYHKNKFSYCISTGKTRLLLRYRLVVLLLCTTGALLNSQKPVIENVEAINTAQSEYSPIYFGDELIFVHQPVNGRFDPASKETYFELFRAPRSSDRRKKSKRFKIELNSSYHEGPITFSKDGRQVFFTKTNAKDGVTVSSSTGEAKLKIYYAYQGQYDWTGVQELTINDDERNTLHPSLSPDGNRLFFASDREADGFGGLDLYVSEWVNGQWTPPINMGPEVNTSGDECYPFIHASGQLFFASNREGGLGNMDLYTLDLSGRQWGKVYRLPPPYNTRFDDFGFILAEDAKSGYLSSNRSGGKGKDDIYAFTAPQGLQSFIGNTSRKEMISVYAAATSQRLSSARIFLSEIAGAGGADGDVRLLRNSDGTFALTMAHNTALNLSDQEFYTAEDGGVEIPLKEGKHYRMMVQKSGYLPEVVRFTYGPAGPSRPLEVVLQSGDCMVVSGAIRSAQNNDPVLGAEVTFYPVDCDMPAVMAKTESDGAYYVCVPANCNYQAVVKHQDYMETKSALDATTKPGGYHQFDLVLLPASNGQTNSTATLSTNSVIVLNGLQYNDDRFELKNNYITELQLLSKLLLEKPSITIRLENHTETGGPDMYHQDMSEKRVEEIRNYLVNSGISPERIQVVAHGASVPRHDCGRPANCNEEQHLSNRRTEVRILSTLP